MLEAISIFCFSVDTALIYVFSTADEYVLEIVNDFGICTSINKFNLNCQASVGIAS